MRPFWDLVKAKDGDDYTGWEIHAIGEGTAFPFKFVRPTKDHQAFASLRNTAPVRITYPEKHVLNTDAFRFFLHNDTNLLGFRHPDLVKLAPAGAVMSEDLITQIQELVEAAEEQRRRYDRIVMRYMAGFFHAWNTQDGWDKLKMLGVKCHELHQRDPTDDRAGLHRLLRVFIEEHVRPKVEQMVVVRVGEQVLQQKMIDIPKTCEPKSGWNSAKMLHFIDKHNETARFLVHVGFMEGLSADEKARRGQAISDGLNLRPAEEKAAAAAAMSAWHAGLSAAQKEARGEARVKVQARDQEAQEALGGTEGGPCEEVQARDQETQGAGERDREAQGVQEAQEEDALRERRD
eukprot:COSAG06_NODE_1030_length_11018_cov_6.347742_2_plen_348_part_00